MYIGSKVFLIYTVFLAGVITFIHLEYTPEIKECGTAILQYDEQKEVFFYETLTSRHELLPPAYASSYRGRSSKFASRGKERSVHVGMPVSYVIYGEEGEYLEYRFKVLSREQWEARLIKSNLGGCIFAFIIFWVLGLGIWWAHWSEETNKITLPVVIDR